MVHISIIKFDGFVKSRKIDFSVIPAPHQERDKLQPVSSKIKKLKSLWTPVFTGVTTFYEAVKSHKPLTAPVRYCEEPEKFVCSARPCIFCGLFGLFLVRQGEAILTD